MTLYFLFGQIGAFEILIGETDNGVIDSGDFKTEGSKIAVTGATGFIGQALVKQLLQQNVELKCWHRKDSTLPSFEDCNNQIQWISGDLTADSAAELPASKLRDQALQLVQGCDAVVHSAYWRPGKSFRETGDDLVHFAKVNLLGTLTLIDAAIAAGVKRFVFVSTCAVHEHILDDRPLDETHPTWATTHYGAHKAALEQFVYSYGLGQGYPICAIRPSAVYGIANPIQNSKWFDAVADIVANREVHIQGGSKEVHVEDVARGIRVLLDAPANMITGQAFACCDRYISRHEVCNLAKEISGSSSEIVGATKSAKHQIVTDKIQSLGMQFGGTELLRATVQQMVDAVRLAKG